MERKEITALLVECEIDEFLVYRDEAEKGTVAVGPDGKKYRFTNFQLEQAEKLREAKIMRMTLAEAAATKPEKKPATKKKAPAKRATAKPKIKGNETPAKKAGTKE